MSYRRSAWSLLLCSLPLVFSSACGSHGLLNLPRPDAATREQARELSLAAIEGATGQLPLDQAEQDLSQALQMNPADPEARWFAAQLAWLRGDREAEFAHWLSAAGTDHPLAEIAIEEAFLCATEHDELRALAEALKAAATRAHSPLVRARAQQVLGKTLRSLGDLMAAEKSFSRLGFLRDWMLLGPFDNDQNAGFDTLYPPEHELKDLTGDYQGKLHKISWRPVEHFGFDGRIPLEALLDPHRWATAYLISHIHSDRAQNIAIRLGAHRGVKLWLNGSLLLSDDEAERAHLDQHVVAARLSKGWNRLLVKVCQRTGRWQLRLRLTDLSGEALRSARGSRQWQEITNAKAGPDEHSSPRAETLSAWLARADDERLQLIAAWWRYRQGFRKQALVHMNRLTENKPKSPLHHMLLAEMQFAAGHEGRALKELARAEELAPGLPRALLRRVEHEAAQKRPDRALLILEPLLARRAVSRDAESLQALLLLRRGWIIDALKAIETSLRSRPLRAWSWRLKAILHRRLDQNHLALRATRRALELQADDAGALDWLVQHAIERHRFAEALSWLRRKQRLWPTHVTAITKEAEVHMAADNYAAAEKALARARAIAPGLWLTYKLSGDAHLRQNAKDQAIAAYLHALELRPNNPDLRDYLDFAQQRKDLVFERYDLTEPSIQKILSARPDRASHDDADAVFLLDDQITHVFADGSAKHLVRQIYAIRSVQGQRQLSRFRVPHSSGFKLIIAETIQADGSRQEATSIQKGAIHLPNLQPGSLLHVAYRYESSSSSWMEDHFAMSFNFQGAYPSKRARWVVALPKDKRLIYHMRGERLQHELEDLGSEQAHIFWATDAPMIHQEPWRPPLRDIRAAVFVSTIPDWNALARWQNSLIQDQFDIDDDIRRTTHQLVAGAKTTPEKIDAIYRFVARDIRYLDHDVGIMGKKPNKAINIFENRFGDCKDKATLMIAMLREVGIQAHYAAVRTRDAGRILLQVPYAQTNHIITYIPKPPGLDAALFVDGTAQFGYFRDLPMRDQDVEALVLTGEAHEMLRTPKLPAEASLMRLKAQARLTDDDLLVMDADESWTGLFTASNRRALVTEGKRAEEWAKRLNRRYPGAQLQQVNFTDLDDLGPSAAARYRFALPGRIRKEGETLRLDILSRSRLLESYAHHPERRTDLFTMREYSKQETIRLELPARYEVETLPQGHTIDDELLHYELAWSREGPAVVVRQNLIWKNRIIPKARYAHLRRLLLDIEQAEAQDLVLLRLHVAQKPLDQPSCLAIHATTVCKSRSATSDRAEVHEPAAGR